MEPCGYSESSAQNLLPFLATGGSLTYSTGLVKHSDHRSSRELLHLNNIIATSEIKSMFNMVSGRKSIGGEYQGGSQAKVDILKVPSNEYLYYFDRVLTRGQPI